MCSNFALTKVKNQKLAYPKIDNGQIFVIGPYIGNFSGAVVHPMLIE